MLHYWFILNTQIYYRVVHNYLHYTHRYIYDTEKKLIMTNNLSWLAPAFRQLFIFKTFFRWVQHYRYTDWFGDCRIGNGWGREREPSMLYERARYSCLSRRSYSELEWSSFVYSASLYRYRNDYRNYTATDNMHIAYMHV